MNSDKLNMSRYSFSMTIVDNETGKTVIEISFNTKYPGEIQAEVFKAMAKLKEPDQ